MIVLVPSTIALLPSYAGTEDPVAELRAACLTAVAKLVADDPSGVGVLCAPARADNAERGVTEPAGLRIAEHLLREVGWAGSLHLLPSRPSMSLEPPLDVTQPLLVVANGSACRSEKAPGHLDDRSFAFDDSLERALVGTDSSALAALDADLAEELWCHDAAAFHALAGALDPEVPGELSYADDPYGVKYWVVTWQ